MTLSKRIGVIVLAGLASVWAFSGGFKLSIDTERILNERLIISRMTASYLGEALNHIWSIGKAADFQTRFPSGEQFSLAAAHCIRYLVGPIYLLGLYLADINEGVNPSRKFQYDSSDLAISGFQKCPETG
jgi:hypothetical protein